MKHFKGFDSLQEVQCSAHNLKTEVKVLSLKMFSSPENTVLAIANPLVNECITFTEYSSCSIDRSDTRNSKLRVLVSDMVEGEVREYGCRVNSFDSFGDTITSTWSIRVGRESEYFENTYTFLKRFVSILPVLLSCFLGVLFVNCFVFPHR